MTTSYFAPVEVALSSPLALNTCDERLHATTERQGSLWYLKSGNAGHTDPRFRGKVTPSRISIARFDETLGRNSFVPYLEARLTTRPDGGTDLQGSIGLSGSTRRVMSLMSVLGGLLLAIALIVGIVLMVQGHWVSALPPLLIPLGIAGLGVALTISGMRSLHQRVQPLLSEVVDLLEIHEPAIRGSAP